VPNIFFIKEKLGTIIVAQLFLKKKRLGYAQPIDRLHPQAINEKKKKNYLDGGLMIKAWNQEVCSFCSFRFEPCGCSYDGH